MHMYVLVRGHKDRQDRWVNDLLSLYYPFKMNKATLEGQADCAMQLGVRPIQLYELVFPEQQLKQVLKDVNPYGGYLPKASFILRKVLKLDECKIKKEEVDGLPKRIFTQDWVSVSMVGLKKDGFQDGVETI